MKKVDFLKFAKAVKYALTYTEINSVNKAIIVDAFKEIGKTEEDAVIFLKALDTAICSLKAPEVDLKLIQSIVFEDKTPKEDIIKFVLIWKNVLEDFISDEDDLNYVQNILGMKEVINPTPDEKPDPKPDENPAA